MPATPPLNEYERLIELSALDLDYDGLREYLKDLTLLAARITHSEVSLVNLIDAYTQWTVADKGLDIRQMPREESVCTHTIAHNDNFEIRDLRRDGRFADKFYVADGPKLRYYFGVPLRTAAGANIGALCVLDPKPDKISPENEELLTMVADQVVRRLESLKQFKALQKEIVDLKASKQKVSHDIRSTLSGIIGISEILKEEFQAKHETEALELIQLIQQGGESLVELADSIMSEKEQQEPDDNQFSCKTLSEKLKDLYLPQARAKGVTLEFRASDQSESVFFPKKYLLQIVGNLLSNSIKFTSNGGWGRVSIHVETQAETDTPSKLIVKVEDNGTGMPEARIQEILGGHAASESGTDEETGYGFGLTLVRCLLDQAGGRMDLQSKLGQGTVFTVELPV